jgi:hypothetical protein
MGFPVLYRLAGPASEERPLERTLAALTIEERGGPRDRRPKRAATRCGGAIA